MAGASYSIKKNRSERGWHPGFVERQLIGYEDEMTSHCIGSIPELFDGNPPFKGRGAVSFAMNVAEILRVLYLLSKYNY